MTTTGDIAGTEHSALRTSIFSGPIKANKISLLPIGNTPLLPAETHGEEMVMTDALSEAFAHQHPEAFISALQSAVAGSVRSSTSGALLLLSISNLAMIIHAHGYAT